MTIDATKLAHAADVARTTWEQGKGSPDVWRRVVNAVLIAITESTTIHPLPTGNDSVVATPSNGGRPSKLTEANSLAILSYVEAGVPLPQASDAAGLSWNTVKDWLAKGRRAGPGDDAYVAFEQAVRRAKGEWTAKMLKRIDVASLEDWRAAAWLTERLVAAFRPPTKVEHTHDLAVGLKAEWTAHLEKIRGLVSPGAFLEVIEATAKLEQLTAGKDGE